MKVFCLQTPVLSHHRFPLHNFHGSEIVLANIPPITNHIRFERMGERRNSGWNRRALVAKRSVVPLSQLLEVIPLRSNRRAINGNIAPVPQVHEEVCLTPESGCPRLTYGEPKRGCYGGIDSIAARGQHPLSPPGSLWERGSNHSHFGAGVLLERALAESEIHCRHNDDGYKKCTYPLPFTGSLDRHDFLLLSQPNKRTDPRNSFKLDLESATGHNSAIAAPARIVIEIDAVHVKIFADLLNFALVARQTLVQHTEELHTPLFLSQEIR
jgi:hypothetical protein